MICSRLARKLSGTLRSTHHLPYFDEAGKNRTGRFPTIMQESLKDSVGEVPKLEYDPVVNTTHDFRLLTIKARGDSQIYGNLTNFSHRSCPRYYALSYEWGNLLSEEPIIVKSCKVEFTVTVTLNLHLALEHLVREHEDLVIWIDAICINQSDDEEKGLQVLHMGDIYARAEETTVWLGPSITLNMLPDDSVVDIINIVGPDASESGFSSVYRTSTDIHSPTKNSIRKRELKLMTYLRNDLKNGSSLRTCYAKDLCESQSSRTGTGFGLYKKSPRRKISPYNGAGIEFIGNISVGLLEPFKCLWHIFVHCRLKFSKRTNFLMMS